MGVREIKARQTACIKFLGQKQYVFSGAGGMQESQQSQCGWITDKRFKVVSNETGEQARRSQDMQNLLNTLEVFNGRSLRRFYGVT